ncbi:MAG: hypothetical protein ABIF18_02260 [archaeon]
MMKNKRASVLHQAILHIILIGLIFAIFLMATAERANGRGVKQQVLEKQIALLIDSAEAGMDFEVRKMNINGLVDSVEVRDGKIFVRVDGLGSSRGYPYFSKYSVDVVDGEDKFVVSVR